jgi:predicted dehydrogenase
MALDLSPEQKAIGEANFRHTVNELAKPDPKNPDRRQFMKGMLAAGAVTPIAAAAWFGYSTKFERPVKAALIGGGDEGGVLMGEHNPEYLQIVAVCDIRPSNQKRIFEGEPAPSPRKGFDRVYGKETARQQIKVYDDYKKMLEDKDIEAVVIALPLFLHAPVAIDCMRAGKHVLCEKLMAWNITQCKEMIKVSEETDRILTIGHQRHYSLLYAHAVELMNTGILGDVHHIRALWHRNNASGVEVDPQTKKPLIDPFTKKPWIKDGWKKPISPEDEAALKDSYKQYGYKSLEELMHWRLYNRTGGGLMAELGSHQLDACSIFLGKVHPIAVSGYGGRLFYRDEREIDDHVFTTFEFPGKNYYKNAERTEIGDKDDRVIVTYSSINTNSFEPYGECVMGSKGTMVVEMERQIMLWPEKGLGGGRSTAVEVKNTAGGPTIDAASTSGPAAPIGGGAAAAAGPGAPPSRGYREEMEHFAYCIRMHEAAKDADEKKKWRLEPHCHGKVAMADAIIALTSNIAMHTHQRIEFKPEWFEPGSDAVPDKDAVVEKV